MARFYAACLASYNAGRYHGAWLHLSPDAEEMGEAIKALLAASPVPNAEEWAVHDYDGVPSSLGEYPGLEGLASAAELLEAAEEQVGDEEDAYDLAKAALDNFGGRTDEAITAIRECFQGSWDKLEDWSWDYLEQAGTLDRIPEDLRSYFDADSWGRDMEIGGSIWTVRAGGKLLVFSNQ